MTNEDFGTDKLSDEPKNGISYTYVNGRIVADEDFDKAIMKNFQTCAGFDIFNGDED
jgi:DNA mismatch repair ATPase MutL